MSVLNSRVFSGMRTGSVDDVMYNDVPVYDNSHDDVVWNGKRGSAYGEGAERDSIVDAGDSFDRPGRANTWADTPHNRDFNAPSRSNTYGTKDDNSEYAHKNAPNPFPKSPISPTSPSGKSAPGRPTAPKPNLASKAAMLKKNEAVALYNFDPDQSGDLGFKKGDVITVLKKTDSDNDWW
jgi:hypothetical protein